MNGTLDVNLWKRWDAKRDVWEGWKLYIYHKSSSLSHIKVQKTKPILQLLKFSLMSCLKGIPPTMDCCISNFYTNGIFVFIAQCPMFFSHLWLHMLFCVYVQWLILVKKTSALSINHQFTWISATINNSNYVPIGMNTIGHESFEVWIGNTILCHHLV